MVVDILTDRELEALFWIANGRHPDEAAQLMGVSRKRVNNLLYDTRQKLQAHTTAHAVSVALQRGYLSLTEIYDVGNPPTKEEWFKNAARFLVLVLFVVSLKQVEDPIARSLRNSRRRREEIELVEEFA